jgi:hypothetical protein
MVVSPPPIWEALAGTAVALTLATAFREVSKAQFSVDFSQVQAVGDGPSLLSVAFVTSAVGFVVSVFYYAYYKDGFGRFDL